MRIVMTRREALDIPDGINTFLFTLADALIAKGHEVTAVSSAWSDMAKIREFYALDHYPSVVSLGEHTSVRYVDSLKAWLRNGKTIIRNLNPDLVILNGAIPLRLAGRTCTVSHDAEKRMEHVPFFRTAFKRFCYSKSDLIVATCDEVRDFLANDLGIAPDRISVIPTCVRLDTYVNRPYSQRENAVLHMGTVDYKNPIATLNAFAGTPASDARLYITGKATPELKAAIGALPAEVRDRVELPGYVSSARLIELLGTVKVVSVPSNYVAPVASPTVIEALAAGTPVVASTSISKFVLRDGENGFIRPSSDADAMAQAYQALLQDRSVWERLSANASASANMFSAGHVADLYLRLGAGQDRVGQAVRQSLSSTAL